MNKTVPTNIILLIVLTLIAARWTIIAIRHTRSVEPPVAVTKEAYLEEVRAVAPDYPDLAVCVYDKYIDRHGIEATMAMDLAYSDPEAVMPSAMQKELSELGRQCLDRI